MTHLLVVKKRKTTGRSCCCRMHVGQISFCDGMGQNIKSDEDKERIMAALQAHGINVLARQFDVVRPNVSRTKFTPALNNIRANPHLMSVRTYGNPYFMYMTTVHGVCQCVFIDRKVQPGHVQPRMIFTRMCFGSDVFSGTVLEGEMVRCRPESIHERPRWIFLVNDMLVERGMTLSQTNLVGRINRLYKLLQASHFPDGLDVCQLQIKKYFPYQEMQPMVHSFIPELPYDVRGIIFKSLHIKFRDVLLDLGANTRPTKQLATAPQSKVQKVTPQAPQASNFQCPTPASAEPAAHASEARIQVFDVRKTSLPDVYELHACSSVGCKPASVTEGKRELACIPNLSISKDMRLVFARVGVTDAIPMRCTYHEKFKKWVPMPCPTLLHANSATRQLPHTRLPDP